MNPRDTIAEMLGYEREVDRWICPNGLVYGYAHPIPNSLDFISRAWPDGTAWWKDGSEEEFVATARSSVGIIASEPHTGDELADRMALYAKVLEWLRYHDRPAFDAAIAKARRVMEEMR